MRRWKSDDTLVSFLSAARLRLLGLVGGGGGLFY